jgi:excisionase family DNA binding protein
MRITVADAAAIYRVPRSTLRRWIAEGRLTAGGQRHHRRSVDPGEVEQLVELLRLTRSRP